MTKAVLSKAARSPEELFPLIEYCRAGNLKAVSEWIAAGHPIDPPQTGKRTRRRFPLEIAIEKGFLTLVETLLDGGSKPEANGGVLSLAVQHREVAIAKLLLERGASADSVWPDDIFDGGPEMLNLFIEHDFDPTTDLAYYHALCSHVHPLLSVLKDYKERFPDLHRQAEMALCHYCEKGNLRAVSLLVWAGARPNARVIKPEHSDDPEMATSPLEEAALAGRLDILKRLKPQDFPEELKTLMDSVWLRPSVETIDYLLELGAPINTKPNGGSKLLNDLIHHLDFVLRPIIGSLNPAKLEEAIKLIEHAVSRGAKWILDPDRNARAERRYLRSLEPDRVVHLFRILKQSGAATVELLESILDSPSLRKRLGDRIKSIQDILHPPAPKPVAAPQTTGERKKVEPKPRPPLEELCARAEEVLLDFLRQCPQLHFTNRKITESIYAQTARRRLALSRSDDGNLTPIFSKAASALNKRLKSIEVGVDPADWSSGSKSFSIRLAEGKEWLEAVRDAWQGVPSPNEFFLSDIGVRLLTDLRSGDFPKDFQGESALAARLGLGARDHGFRSYLCELALKAEIGLSWEGQRENHWGPWSCRIWLEPNDKRPAVAGLNPQLKIDFRHFTKQDLDSTRVLFHQLILKAAPTGADWLYILKITSHRELEQSFPNPESLDSGAIAEFLGTVPLNESVEHAYDFRDGVPCWYFALRPKTDWKTSLSAIEAELAQPCLAERLGISADAAKLIEWIESLRHDELLGCYTPIVEDECERRIGIESPWDDDENFPAYLQMLVDEINEKTDYRLRVQPWKRYASFKSRIRVGREKPDLDDVLQRLRSIAWARGITLDAARTRNTLERLIGGESEKPHPS